MPLQGVIKGMGLGIVLILLWPPAAAVSRQDAVSAERSDKSHLTGQRSLPAAAPRHAFFELAQSEDSQGGGKWWNQSRPRVFSVDEEKVTQQPETEAKPEPSPPKPVVQEEKFEPEPLKKMDWGLDFRSWSPVTGFVKSPAHGNRLVRTYIHPQKAAEIFQKNAETVRLRTNGALHPFPEGTKVVQQSWSINRDGGPGESGPMFFMRKMEQGYDPANGDWEYVLATDAQMVIGEGKGSQVKPCKDCHSMAKSRDFVFATEH